jgi:thiol:disulfide interchange protein DsbD
MRKYLKNTSPILLAIMLIFGASQAFSASNQNFKLNAQPSVKTVKSGDKFWIKLNIKFEKGWHSYSTKKIVGPDGLGPEATVIKVEPKSSLLIDGKIINPKADRHFDEAFETNVEYLPNNSTFEIPVKAKKDLDFSKDKINVIATLQQCNDQACLPLDSYKTTVTSSVYQTTQKVAATEEPTQNNEALNSAPTNQPDTQKTTVAPSNPAVKAEAKKENTNEKKDDFWSVLLIAMGAGAAALLTPCVFPMVPITVSFFTKRSETNKGKGLRDAIVYALGIISTFTALGFVFSIAFGATGIQSFTANPWVNLFIVGIFLLFGFSLFGAYEIQIPTSITNKLNAKSMQGDGISSVILMGLTFSLASFSCTGPLIAGALVSASNGQWFYPIVSMVGFSTVLAAPFFLLALFPSALNSLPRAGGWMNNIKVVLGFFVLAATLKFLNNAFSEWGMELSREMFLSIWAGIGILATLYVLGVFKSSHDSPVDRVGAARLMFALLFATFTFYMVGGLMGKPVGILESYLPIAEEPQIAAVAGVAGAPAVQQDKWYENYAEALKEAKAQNKPLLIDFTGKHCTNCHWMEKKIFPNPEVQSLFSKYVKVKLVTDVQEEPYISNKNFQLNKFQSVALPFYVIVDQNTEATIATQSFSKELTDFTGFLKKGVK